MKILLGQEMKNSRISSVNMKLSISYELMYRNLLTNSVTMRNEHLLYRVKSKCSRNCNLIFSFKFDLSVQIN